MLVIISISSLELLNTYISDMTYCFDIIMYVKTSHILIHVNYIAIVNIHEYVGPKR